LLTAEQGIPGGKTGSPKREKGVAAMGKNVFNRLIKLTPVALAMIGWVAFVLGLIVQPIVLKVMLLSAARVLP